MNSLHRLTPRTADGWTRGVFLAQSPSQHLPVWPALVRPAAADADRWAATTSTSIAQMYPDLWIEFHEYTFFTLAFRMNLLEDYMIPDNSEPRGDPFTDNHVPMTTTPHSQAKLSALYACFILGIFHYAAIVQLSAANFTQNMSFIPPLFALLAGSHASIGFVSGYIAGKYHYGIVFNAMITLLGFLSGLVAAFAVVVILTSLVETTQRPLAQHMLAYATTLGSFGAGTSFVTGMLYTLVRQQGDV